MLNHGYSEIGTKINVANTNSYIMIYPTAMFNSFVAGFILAAIISILLN